MPGLQGKYEQY